MLYALSPARDVKVTRTADEEMADALTPMSGSAEGPVESLLHAAASADDARSARMPRRRPKAMRGTSCGCVALRMTGPVRETVKSRSRPRHGFQLSPA